MDISYSKPVTRLVLENEENPSPQVVPLTRFKSGIFPQSPQAEKEGWRMYQQWLNCITALDIDHLWCKKARWYAERAVFRDRIQEWDQLWKKGAFEPSVLGRTTEPGSDPVGAASLFSETPVLHKNLLIFRSLWQKVRKNEEGLLPGWYDKKKTVAKTLVETSAFEDQYKKIAEALQKEPAKFSEQTRRRWEFGEAHTPLYDEMIALERERADKLTGKVMLYPPRNWPFEPINYERPEAFELFTDFGRDLGQHLGLAGIYAHEQQE